MVEVVEMVELVELAEVSWLVNVRSWTGWRAGAAMSSPASRGDEGVVECGRLPGAVVLDEHRGHLRVVSAGERAVRGVER
jgi:hypothetical protein